MPKSKSERISDFALDNSVIDIAIAHERFFEGLREDSARTAFDRLEARRWFQPYRYGDLRYWTLHRREARRRGVSKRKAGQPLTRGGLLDAYGRIYSERLPGVKLRYPARQFREHFPSLVGPGAPAAGYYLDDSAAEPRLGLLIVDHNQHPKRVLARAHRVTTQRLGLTEFRGLVESRGFVLLVVTATEPKMRRLQELFRGKEPDYVAVRFGVVPELRRVLFAKEIG